MSNKPLNGARRPIIGDDLAKRWRSILAMGAACGLLVATVVAGCSSTVAASRAATPSATAKPSPTAKPSNTAKPSPTVSPTPRPSASAAATPAGRPGPAVLGLVAWEEHLYAQAHRGVAHLNRVPTALNKPKRKSAGRALDALGTWIRDERVWLRGTANLPCYSGSRDDWEQTLGFMSSARRAGKDLVKAPVFSMGNPLDMYNMNLAAIDVGFIQIEMAQTRELRCP